MYRTSCPCNGNPTHPSRQVPVPSITRRVTPRNGGSGGDLTDTGVTPSLPTSHEEGRGSRHPPTLTPEPTLAYRPLPTLTPHLTRRGYLSYSASVPVYSLPVPRGPGTPHPTSHLPPRSVRSVSLRTPLSSCTGFPTAGPVTTRPRQADASQSSHPGPLCVFRPLRPRDTSRPPQRSFKTLTVRRISR